MTLTDLVGGGNDSHLQPIGNRCRHHHGTRTLAIALKELIAARQSCGSTKLKRFTGRFSSMVIPGSSIRVRHATMSEGSEFEVVNVDGELAISRGRAIVVD